MGYKGEFTLADRRYFCPLTIIDKSTYVLGKDRLILVRSLATKLSV